MQMSLIKDFGKVLDDIGAPVPSGLSDEEHAELRSLQATFLKQTTLAVEYQQQYHRPHSTLLAQSEFSLLTPDDITVKGIVDAASNILGNPEFTDITWWRMLKSSSGFSQGFPLLRSYLARVKDGELPPPMTRIRCAHCGKPFWVSRYMRLPRELPRMYCGARCNCIVREDRKRNGGADIPYEKKPTSMTMDRDKYRDYVSGTVVKEHVNENIVSYDVRTLSGDSLCGYVIMEDLFHESLTDKRARESVMGDTLGCYIQRSPNGEISIFQGNALGKAGEEDHGDDGC